MSLPAIYARVSTREQSLDMQLSNLRTAAGSPALEFRDWGRSGVDQARPALGELMSACRRREVSTVYVWKFDRFARSVSHLLRALEEFRALGVRFVSLTEAVDTGTPMGLAIFTILGAVARLERDLNAERTAAGLAAARGRGVHIGRPRAKVDLDRARMYLARGASKREAAEMVGVSLSVLKRRLRLAAAEPEGPEPPLAA